MTTPVTASAPGETFATRFRAGEERGARIGRVLRLLGRVREVDEDLMRELGQGFDRVDEPAVASSPLDHVTQQEALQFLERFLERLDDSRRTVFVMIELEQVPAPEVARALGVNLNTVYSRLRSARQAFAAALSKRTAGALR